jgi:lipoprotein-anchoring transpeptidase ErfK/SrfK
VNGAVGIHGTAEEWSIGSRASHGCIRMRVSDVIELYRRVPVGTPVLIR